MTVPGVVYFTSAGDSGLGPDYPSVSPNTISAGGTHIVRSNGSFTGEEDCWSGSGGGISTIEPLPNYQLIIGNITGPHRGTPDIAAVADPNTGVAVYSTTGCGGWCQVGGTSVSSPTLAGIVNAAGSFVQHSASELGRFTAGTATPGSTARTCMTSPRAATARRPKLVGTSAPVSALRETLLASNFTAM